MTLILQDDHLTAGAWYFYWEFDCIFLSLREVANIPLQSLKISPWPLICKMIISQLELGPPVVGSAWVDASRSLTQCLAMCIQARDHVLQRAYWLHDSTSSTKCTKRTEHFYFQFESKPASNKMVRWSRGMGLRFFGSWHIDRSIALSTRQYNVGSRRF